MIPRWLPRCYTRRPAQRRRVRTATNVFPKWRFSYWDTSVFGNPSRAGFPQSKLTRRRLAACLRTRYNLAYDEKCEIPSRAGPSRFAAGNCLTPESARRVLAIKADRKLQAHVDDLAARHSEGRLSPAEEAEYGRYVSFCTFVAILKSKERQLFAASGDS